MNLNTGIHSCFWKDYSVFLKVLMAWIMFRTNLKLCIDFTYTTCSNKRTYLLLSILQKVQFCYNRLSISQLEVEFWGVWTAKFAAKQLKLFIVFTNEIAISDLTYFKTYLFYVLCFRVYSEIQKLLIRVGDSNAKWLSKIINQVELGSQSFYFLLCYLYKWLLPLK